MVQAKSNCNCNFETEMPQNMNQHPYILMIRKLPWYKWDNPLRGVRLLKNNALCVGEVFR